MKKISFLFLLNIYEITIMYLCVKSAFIFILKSGGTNVDWSHKTRSSGPWKRKPWLEAEAWNGEK